MQPMPTANIAESQQDPEESSRPTVDSSLSTSVNAPGAGEGSSAGRLSGWQFWLLNTLALLGLATVVVNIILALGNQQMQAEVNQRQQLINDGIRLSRLNTQLIQTLAETSARTGDAALRNLLASHGIDFTIKPTSSVKPGAGKEEQ